MGGQVLDLPEFKLYDQGKADGLREGRADGLREGRADGLREGRADGLREGRADGIRAGSLEILVSLVKDGIIDETEAVKRSGLTREEFKKLL